MLASINKNPAPYVYTVLKAQSKIKKMQWFLVSGDYTLVNVGENSCIIFKYRVNPG